MTNNEQIKKKCFVITPIGEEGSQIRRHIDGIINASIKPALENKYEVIAAHHINTTGSINNQVIAAIYNADLVVANLTGLNPNVMYELALRHALKKPVIMIMEKGSKSLPFDVINERTIFYINDSQGVLDLKREIENVEEAIKIEKISNPIYDALNNFISEENLIKDIKTKSTDDANVLKVILDKLNKLESSKKVIQDEDDYILVDAYIKLISKDTLSFEEKEELMNGLKNLLFDDEIVSNIIMSIKSNIDDFKMILILKLVSYKAMNNTKTIFKNRIEKYLNKIRNISYDFDIIPF